jgi:hypothetical protein
MVISVTVWIALLVLGAPEPAHAVAGLGLQEPQFSFRHPAGPQFTESQKQAQRQAGQTVVPRVLEAFRKAADSVRIPPGDYRFGQETWDANWVIRAYPLEFKDLVRDAAHPFTIDATGATFWFDLENDQSQFCYVCVGFRNCSHITFKGATLDRGTRGHVEGRVTQLDFTNNRIELELSPGITVPDKFNHGIEQRVVPFKADGRFCAPLYALQAGGVHLKYQSITPGSAPNRVYVNLVDTALLDQISDPSWIKAHGDLGVLRVGDGLSCVYTVSGAIELVHCKNLRIEGLKVYIAKGWGAEWGGDGGHLWKNCYFGPRPGTSQWQGGEGFMFCATRHGPTVDHITIMHTTDDAANIHGYWGHIHGIAGNRVTFEPSLESNRTVLHDLVAGDRLLFRDKATGQPLGSAAVTGVQGMTVTISSSADSFTNAIVEWPDHECAGWTIQNCDWHDNYQRLLIQSGPGTVRHCRFTRLGGAIELNTVMGYLEGSVPCDIRVEDNRFVSVASGLPASISVYAQTFSNFMPSLIQRVCITGNRFDRPKAAAIGLKGVTDCTVVNNRFHEGQRNQ